MLRSAQRRVAVRNGYPTTVARRRQPSSGRIEAVESRGRDPRRPRGRRGDRDERARTAHGPSRQHRVAPARHPRRGRSRRAGRRVGAVPPRDPRRPACERRSRTPRRPPHRSPPPRGARADHRRDRDAPRARRGGRGHGRLRAQRALHPARDAARPPVDRPCDLGGEGDACLHRPPPPPRAAPCVHATDDHEREGALCRDRARAGTGLRRGVRGARAGPRGSRRTGVVVDRRRSPRSSRSRARPRASADDEVGAAVAPLLERARAISAELGWVPG